MEKVFCYNCGSQIAPGGRFCSACGTPVLTQSEPAPMPEPEPAFAPEIPEAVPPAVFSLDDLLPSEPEPAPELISEPVSEPIQPVFTLDELPHAEEIAPAGEPETVHFDAEPEIPVVIPAPQPAAEPFYQPQPAPVQPVYPTPAPTPAPVDIPAPMPAPAAKPTKGILARRGVGRTILAVLLCIVIFLWSFATLSLFNIRIATTDENAAATIEAALRTVDLTELPATAVIKNADPELSMAEWILEKTAQNFEGRVTADEDELQEFLEDSDVIPFLSERLSEYVNDVYKGNARKALSADDIEEFLWDERENMKDIFGTEITRDSARRLAKTVEESGVLELLSTRTLKANYSQIYSLANLIMSWWILGILAVILVLLILLLGTANRSILRTFSDTGITLMVASGIWGLCGLFYLVLPGAWSAIFSFIQPLDTIIGSVLKSCLIPTAAVFGTGVVLVLIRVIGKKIVHARAAKQA